MQPFVSVLVATYNQSDYLAQCLDSLVNQSLPSHDYEVVLIDDGSTDATPSVIADFRWRVQVLTHPERMGLITACNDGLAKASGTFFVRVDSDDWLDSSGLEQLTYAAEESPGVDIVIPDYWVVEEKSTTVVRPDLRNVFSWMAGGPLLRREAVLEAGGYREFFWEEYDLYLRMLGRGASVRGLSVPILYHRVHSQSMTSRPEHRARGWQELLDAWPQKTMHLFGSHSELDEILRMGRDQQ